MKIGVLLINLGTPEAPTSVAVRRYLREFLLDPFVIDIPTPLRWGLVYGIILPFRPRRSAEAYRKIWTEAGSPLLVNSQALVEKVQHALDQNIKTDAKEKVDTFVVVLGMRYGTPSIASALKQLVKAGVQKIVAFPLYPQYSLAATESSIVEVQRVAREIEETEGWAGSLAIHPPFYDHPAFIEAFARVGEPLLESFRADHVLFSFHGLPERQIKRVDASRSAGVPPHCFASENCCAEITAENRNCYRAQSFATARALARRLGITGERFSVSFQSRLTRDPWIQPFTDERVLELARQGVKRLAVYCPAFVADCLETLEEIAIRADDSFRKAGGEKLLLIESLNATDYWAKTLADWARVPRAGKKIDFGLT